MNMSTIKTTTLKFLPQGDASDHYGKLMKVLFPTEYNRFHTELAEQFLVHVETVKDKAFVTAAVDHFMDHFYRFPGAHHRTILLDLVIKFIKEKWISRSDKYYHSYATKMYQMLKRLLDSSSGFAETITVLLLENWSCVCKYFMPKDIKDILKDIEKVVESNVFKETDQLLKLVETYLLEECVHDIECGTLIKIFYKDEKIFASRVLGKIRDNKDKYTQALLMKLSKYAEAISTRPPFSEPSSASNSLLLMALEACSKKCRACKVVGSSIESRLQLYVPTEKELKYFVIFFEVIGSSVNNNLMNTIEFFKVLDKLKIIFISSYDIMMEFINLVKKHEIQEKVMKLLEDTIVECCRERFIEEVRKSNYSKHSILVDNLIEACRLCVDNVTNGKLLFQERVINHLLEKFKTKEKTCEKIKAQFSER